MLNPVEAGKFGPERPAMIVAARVAVNELKTRPRVQPGSVDRDPKEVEDLITAAYRDHAGAIRGFALRSTRDPEQAADATHEAFLRLVTEVRARRCPDNIGAWLYRTTSNFIISRARREAVARRLAPRLVRIDGPAQPDVIAVLNEAHQELRSALLVLPVADRIVLLMAARGASGQEIAVLLGRSHGATRTLLSRARARLRAARLEMEPPVGRMTVPDAPNALVRAAAMS